MTRVLKFGALAPKLSEQIEGLPPWYDNADRAISMLYIGGIITNTESIAARKKLVKKIESWLKTKGEK
jgi:hypothetical protein